MNSQSRALPTNGLAHFDSSPEFQDLVQDLREVTSRAEFLEDEAAIAACRDLAGLARRASLNYSALLREIHQQVLAIYGSRPEECAAMLAAKAAELTALGMVIPEPQSAKDNVVYLTKGVRTG